MERINVNDRVQIIQIEPGGQQLLHKFGTVILISDGRQCVVALDDGSVATVKIGQLKKA